MSLKEDLEAEQRKLTLMYKAMGVPKSQLIDVLTALVEDPENDKTLKWHIELIEEIYAEKEQD
jgi:hypothetical protein